MGARTPKISLNYFRINYHIISGISEIWEELDAYEGKDEIK